MTAGDVLRDKRAAVRRLLAGTVAGPVPDAYERHVNPRLAGLLHGLGLDVTFVRGQGTRLYDAAGLSYLDFAGAYGALPFGHNPPEIWQAVEAVRQDAEPSLIQPAPLAAAGELAERLVQLAPGDLTYAFFCNSGAEAVEAALKVARAATGRLLVVSTTNAFHGKTLGALSATGRPRYQTPFGAPARGFATVPFGDADALEAVFAARGDRIAAFLVEPVQGEGGVHPAPPGYLAHARALCTRYGARLVVDEVQTGLGRTGRMFACEHDGVAPDIITLAKALGGGVVPIGAVLFGADSMTDDFALRHTSTFGGNAFCARVGLHSLDLLTADGQRLVRSVAERGERLRSDLDALAAAHPRVVREVRGRGLLLGVELSADPAAYPRQGLFRSLAEQEGLAGFVCGHLLRVEQIRLAPAYFAASVLRVEPPLTVTGDECTEFVDRLDRVLTLLDTGDSARFWAFLADGPTVAGRPSATDHPPPAPRPGEPRWAFLVHPTDDASYESFDAGLGWPGWKVRRLFDRLSRCRTPDACPALFVGACRVTAGSGDTSYGEVFALGYSARQLLDLPAAEATALIQEAVDRAVARGAQIVGLGAYTSVITANATALRHPGVPVTTGNAYTVATGVDGLLGAAVRSGVDVCGATAAVLGAGGAIGRAAALLLAESVDRLWLVGNPATPQRSAVRLASVAADVVAHLRGRGAGGLAARVAGSAEPDEVLVASLAAEGRLVSTVDTDRTVAAAGLVLAATSAPVPLIRAEVPRPGAVICDISQPSNVGADVAAARPDLTIVTGGLVDLPGRQDFGVDLGLPRGVVYACTAETLVLAHRLPHVVVSRGDRLDVELVRAIGTDARLLGFALHTPVPDMEGAGHDG